MYIDTHCHLDFPDYRDDREKTVSTAIKNGVTHIINVGTDIPSSEKSLQIASEYSAVYAAAGIHPSEVQDIDLSSMERISGMLKNRKVVAVGETGLDFHYGRHSEQQQKDFFSAHIELAAKKRLPLIIHQRESRQETIDVMNSCTTPDRVVFHCFGEDEMLAAYCLKHGFYISFTGIITFKNAREIREVCRGYPIELIMAETDAPFLSPVPLRGKRNQPANVRYIAETIASIKGMDLTLACKKIFNNSLRFFNLSH